MKTHSTLFLLLATCLPLGSLLMAEPDGRLVSEYYDAFNSSDGNTLRGATRDLVKEVPRADWPELFAAIIDRAAKVPDDSQIIAVVASFSYSENPKLVWGGHLEQSLVAQATNSDASVRATIAHLLTNKQSDKYRELCLSFLKDPDDYVRERAITGIGTWKDGRELAAKYIQEHASSPEYARSVRKASMFTGTYR